MSLHQYADDSQIYGSCPPATISSLSTDTSQAVDNVSIWMWSNRLQLNDEKTEVMWCVSACRRSQLPRCPITVAGASVEPVSVVCDLGVYIDSDLGAATRVTLFRCTATTFDIYVDTSPTNVFVLSLSCSFTAGSTTATSCLSGFLPTFNDAYRPYSMLQPVCSDFNATTTSLMPSRYCTGCVCRNKLISSWRLWCAVCWMVWCRRTWINLFQYPALLVGVYSRLSHCSCSSRHTVCQQSAVAHFRSQPLCSGTLCQMTFSLHHQFLPSVDF